MRTIDNLTFNFTFTKDTYILTSKLLIDLEYTLTLVEDGKPESIISTGTILGINPIRFITLTILNDARYRLDITDFSDSIYFTHSIRRRNLLIPLIRTTVCDDCKCKKPCNGCTTKEMEDCVRNQSLFTFIQTYIYINKDFSINGYLPISDLTLSFYKKTYNALYFYFNEQLCNQLLQTHLDGQAHTNQQLFNYQIAIYYLGLYFEAKLEIDALDIESLQYLDKVYDYKKISECIKRLGICIEDMEDDFNLQDSFVYYWQLGLLETIDDVIPLLSVAYLNTKPAQALNVFEQGFNVPLLSVGKLAFAISNIDNQLFIIYDSLGNDVTANFTTYYNLVIRTILFVSIPSYTPSNIFFKFKQI